ncbi:ATP-binding SpoIIE family protein phosphatase [Actinacidiphila sp. ITFR-21]|uniref:ATP-binding SpoIIE family protein phosphatase n=1 Tax=Actinacidiphila sp. ITFR-21 TaxID=3075199 RepID=UPI00288C3D4F|nr:SpoIIE family protein phosphatase [Streptomyces sp. ITFR-21]WNI14142.1 SpoIIE family protein phosphatase [Streptomyces sp. ITFR-21]
MGGGGDEPAPEQDRSGRDPDRGQDAPARDTGRQGPDRRPREGRPDAWAPDGGAPGPGTPLAGQPDASDQDLSELRQIDALNRLDPARPGGAPPESGARRRDLQVFGAGHDLAGADSLTDVLKAVARLRAPDFDLDGLAVFAVTGRFLDSVGQHGFRRPDTRRTVRISLSTRYPAVDVVRSGQPVYLPTAAAYRERYPAAWPMTALVGRTAWAFLPLVTAGRITGVWLAAFRTPVGFTAQERALLMATARLLAQALERTRTGEAELALSRGLRRSMGAVDPALPGLTLATRYVPTGGGLVVGGDWYDCINLPTGRLGLVVGDVQGHDVHAAGLMAQLRTAVHAYAAEGHGPDAVLSRTSRFLTALDADRFATCLYVDADPATGVLQIARAGHPHPVLRMPDGTCVIKHIRGGLPLGLMPDADDYPVSVVELRPEEVMLLCTDGLIETGGFDMYTGWVRVRDALVPGPADDLEAMADRLIQAVGSPMSGTDDARLPPRNEDDIALLLLRRDSGPQPAAVPERRLVLAIEQDQAEGVAEARTELRSLLHDWARPDQVDTAVLLSSELLGNVLMHTDQPAALVATVTGKPGRRTLRVEVADSGDGLPHQRAPGEMASSGRGLVLLDILSDQWGVRPKPEGKTVWFAMQEAGDPGEEG